ncbi:alpha/beta fold hydrolase [Chitinophaga nivalis]|uniref:Alpha/beta hydrolase n=1 Tax=Chitinophaga nivalis TaxID=2991709 RepID=A0ABT3IPN2_9BACT|nr:alpha/beta hydrolase [Chitinophaga nivalis]MCW3464380.1 alpha/beta hydrolase [Chitinophaga nivalis]MCW3485929.1 alpha/beta hydrolase [Chitinophaga nivalis]
MISTLNTTASEQSYPVYHKTIEVDGVHIFYREAGDTTKPTLLLLHGFPSSSHNFRTLIPLLKDDFHILAPDYPGFGFSDMPAMSAFDYTFENYALYIEKFLFLKGVHKCSMYLFDYGAPVGMRIIQRNPGILENLIVQNGNIYAEGLSDILKMYRKNIDENTAASRAEVYKAFELEYTMFEYLHGVSDPTKVAPESYQLDQFLMNRPGNKEIQYKLKYDYRFNIAAYPQWQQTLRKIAPRVLIVWGENDPVFLKAGALAFKKDIAEPEIHFYPTGHFALEEYVVEIAARIKTFLKPKH